MEVLRGKANAARDRLIADRSEFKALLAQFEADARKCGWQVELTLGPPMPSPDGLAELSAFPAVLHLTPAKPGSPPGMKGLLEWMNGISRLPKHAEVTGVVLGGNGAGPGISTVRVEVRVLGKNSNEEVVKE